MKSMIWAKAVVCAALCVSAISCGGGRTLSGSGTGGGTATNVASVLVDAGPANNTVNTMHAGTNQTKSRIECTALTSRPAATAVQHSYTRGEPG